jgi:hypothetical protein
MTTPVKINKSRDSTNKITFALFYVNSCINKAIEREREV